MFTALCWMGSAWGLYLGREGLGLSRGQSIVVGSVVMASGWVSFLGMEAHLFAFLLVVAVVLYFKERWLLTGVVVGLLFLTRGEGILLLPTFVLYRLLTIWRKVPRLHLVFDKPSLKLFLGCFTVFCLWSLYAWRTFGLILPETLSAKMAQKATGYWTPFLSRLLNQWIPTWGQQFSLPFYPFLNLWWILISIGLVYILFRKPQWLVLLIWISFYVVGYIVLDVAGYWWYQLPILFVMQIIMALGLIAMQEALVKFRGRPKYAGYIVSIVLTVFVVVLLARSQIEAILLGTGDPRASSYLVLTDWINENTDPAQSVAYVEIGYLGYYTDNRIIDLLGLVTPGITQYVAQGDFAQGFWLYQPDYLVYLPDFDWILADIVNDNHFAQNYRVGAVLSGPRETDFIIYERIATYQ